MEFVIGIEDIFVPLYVCVRGRDCDSIQSSYVVNIKFFIFSGTFFKSFCTRVVYFEILNSLVFGRLYN